MAQQLPIPSPDFDTIKESLKQFLKGQDAFTDYDFDGSTLSAIVDVLSYNTHINAFYLNMVANESFMGTAVKRDSVVQKALQLGYVPKSVTSSIAILDITLYASSEDSFMVIPADTVFEAKTDTESFTFRTYESFTAERTAQGVYEAKDVRIHEGKKLQYNVIVDSLEKVVENRYVIPNANVDTSVLRVYASEPNNPTQFQEYVPAQSILDLNPQSLAYYLEESAGGLHSVSFGDDILSRRVSIGQIVKIDYIVSKGKLANGIRKFSLLTSLPGLARSEIKVTAPASGGSDSESIASIKFNAPRNFAVQNRAVTAYDYQQIITNIFQNVDDVIAKGGEEVFPPQYNKVVVFIKPKSGTFLPEAEKRNLVNRLKDYATVLSQVVILDPEYLLINVFSEIDYDPVATVTTESDLKFNIAQKIKNYSQDFLGKFTKDLRYSQFVSFIDQADSSIVSNITQLQVEKRIFISITSKKDYSFSFSTQLQPSTFVSSGFSLPLYPNSYFQDDGNGNIIVRQIKPSGEVVTVEQSAGKINYQTGSVDIFPVLPSSIIETDEYFNAELADYFVKFKAAAKNVDINRASEQIILINEVNLKLNKG